MGKTYNLALLNLRQPHLFCLSSSVRLFLNSVRFLSSHSAHPKRSVLLLFLRFLLT